MNITCPNSGKVCFKCEQPCAPYEVHANALAVPEAAENGEFAGILGTLENINKRVNMTTNFEDEVSATITIPI